MGYGPYRAKGPETEPADYDLSLPLATLLRQGTARAHEAAEHSQGAGWLLRGELDREEYARFLMMLYHIYLALENALDEHAASPVLAPTYNPGLLTRAPRIALDIAHLLDVPDASWEAHPVHQELLAHPPAPFTAYVERVRELGAAPADAPPAAGPGRLLAHSYVRYLGDLAGGQVIRKRIAKAYGIPADESAGVEFYRFGSLDGARADADVEDRKAIREWFRDGMTEGAGEDEELKLAILKEAVLAFDLNTGLFTALRAPTTRQPPTLDTISPHTVPPPGIPTSPVPTPMSAPSTSSDSSASSSARSSPTPSDTSLPKEMPVVVEHSSDPTSSSTMVTVSGVFTVVGAICLAHFLLVVGGVTGSKGWISKIVESL